MHQYRAGIGDKRGWLSQSPASSPNKTT